MDFDKRYDHYRAIAENSILTACGRFSHVEETLAKACIYSLTAGGKRLRPVLFLSVLDAFGCLDEKYYPLAAALEFIHTSSLVHDDLPALDNDDMRRGMPSAHKKFGEAFAVISGDALLNAAYELCFNLLCDDGSVGVRRACRYISVAAGAGGMLGGQGYDLDEEKKTDSEEYLLKTDLLKTSALIRAAIVSAGLIADKNIDETEVFGDKLGLMFQFVDDLLDATGDSFVVGKTLGKDSEEGKITAVSVYGIDGLSEKITVLKNECLEYIDAVFDIDNRPFFKELVERLARRSF